MNAKKIVLNLLGIVAMAAVLGHCGKKTTTDSTTTTWSSNLPSKISSSAK